MEELEPLTTSTCNLLGAAELKAICRFRGFNPPAGDKTTLAAFVAPRLLRAGGAAEAMATLEKPWLLVLHAIAMAEQPASLHDLLPVMQGGKRHYHADYRGLFRKMAEGLLSRGVVLVADPPQPSSRGSRFEPLTFHVAPAHLAALPPFPVPTRALGPRVESRDALAQCRAAVVAAARTPPDASVKKGDKQRKPAPGLPARIAGAISFAGGELRLCNAAVAEPATFLRRVRSLWTEVGGGDRSGRAGALSAAAYILAHLPAGQGVSVEALGEALSRLGLGCDTTALDQLCGDGYDAGLLVASGAGEERLFAVAAAPPADGDDLLFTAVGADGGGAGEGIEVDLERSGLAPVLQLAAVSRVEGVGGKLHMRPDIVKLGRARDRLASMTALRQARGGSVAYDSASRHVEGAHGKLLVHEGLLVMRIDDLGLRTLLSHELGASLRALGGPYLAAPRGLATHIERIARKEGFAPRRIS